MKLPEWARENVAEICQDDIDKAQNYQDTLTKPRGSLGLLEDVAIKFCAWQKTMTPRIDNIVVRIFAADHGVCKQGVSAFPQTVTS